MKKQLFVLLSCLAITLQGYGEQSKRTFLTQRSKMYAKAAEGERFLLTFPRSGTNLTICYLQALIKCRVEFVFDPTDMHPAVEPNRLNLVLDPTKPILYRTHDHDRVEYFPSDKNKLLVVLRNYREALLRQVKQRRGDIDSQELQDILLQEAKGVRRYMNILNTYHEWDPDHRLLVYYEDLLNDPITELERILNFFEEPVPETLTEELLQEVRQQTLASYEEQFGSYSKGEDVTYHSKQLPENFWNKFDSRLQQSYPELCSLYLQRYFNPPI